MADETKRRCVNCGSERLAGWGRVADTGPNDHYVAIDRKPEAMLFGNPINVVIRALLCGSCGYVALFADKPEQMYEQFVAAFPDQRRD